jgi:sugar phosphate permease
MAALSAGLVYFTQVSVDGSYTADLLPGFLLIAIGLVFSGVPVSIVAVAGVRSSEAGLASGLINTSQQIGGAVGIAVLSAIATSTTDDRLAAGSAAPGALTDGFRNAFVGATVIALVGVVVALFAVRRKDLAEPERRESICGTPLLEAV